MKEGVFMEGRFHCVAPNAHCTVIWILAVKALRFIKTCHMV